MYDSIDGILDPEKFSKAKIKILWILREPSVDDKDKNERIDTCQKFREGEHRVNVSNIPTYRTIIYATYRIFNYGVSWSDIPCAKEESYDVFLQTALININKKPGNSSSKPKVIAAAFQMNRNKLINQINEINPEVIIFGGTYELFDNEAFDEMKLEFSEFSEIDHETKYVSYSITTNGKLLIKGFHPSAIKKNYERSYTKEISEAVNIWQKIRNNSPRII
ncbi:MAG TPA: hypothetical protein PKN32_11535 [Bacteroidales bacterium]|nr:hypothetical protein [Bacteroidales bacterium]